MKPKPSIDQLNRLLNQLATDNGSIDRTMDSVVCKVAHQPDCRSRQDWKQFQKTLGSTVLNSLVQGDSPNRADAKSDDVLSGKKPNSDRRASEQAE